METPILRIEDVAPEWKVVDTPVNIPDHHPELMVKGQDYNTLGELLLLCSYDHCDMANVEYFWSPKLLTKIVTRDRIIEELQRYQAKDKCFQGQNLEGLADRILFPSDGHKNGFLRIFALLVLVNKVCGICDFFEESVSDSDIPIVKARTVKRNWNCILARRQSPSEPLHCSQSEPWDLNAREMFLKRQRGVDVVYLDLKHGKVQHRNDFDTSTVFPWLKFEFKEHGGYAAVYTAVAPPDCHAFERHLSAINLGNKFAVKELKKKNADMMKNEEKEFWNEVNMLKRFSGIFHDHLVTLLMTWSIENTHYFLFPHAPCDLDQYWAQNKCPVETHVESIHLPTIQWVSKQILGISEALNRIHNPKHLREEKFGRHGDLKPENILWYESPTDKNGILVIADFGLGAFNSAKSRSNMPGAAVPGTPTYRPPECDLEGGMISRSFDIWTYGCILLEWTCWALGGNELRKAFEEYRETPYITRTKTDIFFDVERIDGSEEYVVKRKDKVTQWITDLHNHAYCTQYFHTLLELIEGKMVIVEASSKRDRIQSSELVKVVRDMHERAMTDPAYAIAPCPEAREVKSSVAFRARLNQTALCNIKKNKGEKGEELAVHRGEVRESKSPEQLRALAHTAQ